MLSGTIIQATQVKLLINTNRKRRFRRTRFLSVINVDSKPEYRTAIITRIDSICLDLAKRQFRSKSPTTCLRSWFKTSIRRNRAWMTRNKRRRRPVNATPLNSPHCRLRRSALIISNYAFRSILGISTQASYPKLWQS